MVLDATRLRVLVAVARYGSVTAAAHALNYAQPSISHHMAKLEAETGAKLMERSGRGVKLTEAGQLLAERAEEILGRLDAAEAELAAHVGLRQERVRLAAFGSALSTLVAAGVTAVRAQRVGSDVLLTQAEPAQALRMLRAGAVDIALTFRYLIRGAETTPAEADPAYPRGDPDLRYQLLLDEPLYLITPAGQVGAGISLASVAGGVDLTAPASLSPVTARIGTRPAADLARLADYAGHRWIAGCERCRDNLVRLCSAAGFTANIAISTDDYVSAQAFVAAGLGVTILPSLALRAARHPGVALTDLSGASRQVHAVTYGTSPVSPATGRLIEALKQAAA